MLGAYYLGNNYLGQSDLFLTLDVQETLQAHASDNLTLTQAHQLAPDNSLHSHTVDNLVLSQVHLLAAQDTLHSHSADSLLITQIHFLAVQEALQNHTAENLLLAVTHHLLIQEALQGHSADSLTVIYNIFLSLADTLHGQAADNVTVDVLMRPTPPPPLPKGLVPIIKRHPTFPIIVHERNIKEHAYTAAPTALVDDPIALVDDTTALAGKYINYAYQPPLPVPKRVTIISKGVSDKPKGVKP